MKTKKVHTSRPSVQLRTRLVENIITIVWDGVDVWEYVALTPDQAQIVLAAVRVKLKHRKMGQRKQDIREGVQITIGTGEGMTSYNWIDKNSKPFDGQNGRSLIVRLTQLDPVE